MAIQRVSSKWEKTKVLLQNEEISGYIPLTYKYNWDALDSMLKVYPMVYIKPDQGTYGNGVMRIEQLPDQDHVPCEQIPIKYKYLLYYDTTVEIFPSLEPLHTYITSHIRKHTYLIQQGIVSLQYNNRSFDLRVLTQKSPNHRWASTGILGRVAAPNKVVTNHHNGGSVYMMDILLSNYMNRMEVFKFERSLHSLGTEVAVQLEKKYPRIKELGLDVAIDSNLKPWILEVNTLPALIPFKKFIPDKHIYKRIHRYALSYGRYSSKKRRV
ncbi:MAG TPA: YheC/YheD family protein [Paenibacillus sp.]